MDALTAKVRDALLAEGAAPATAEMLAVDFVERSRRKVEQDRRDNMAQRLLPLGPQQAADRLGVAVSTVYKMVHRARKGSTPEPIT